MLPTSWCDRRPSSIRATPHRLRGVSNWFVGNICGRTWLSALQLVEPMLHPALLRTLGLNSLNLWRLSSGRIVTAIFRGRLREFISHHRSVRLVLDNWRLLFRRAVLLNLRSLQMVVVDHSSSIIPDFQVTPIQFSVCLWFWQLGFVQVSLPRKHIKSRRLIRFGGLCGFLLRRAVKLPDVLKPLVLRYLLDRCFESLVRVKITRFGCLDVEHLVALHAYVSVQGIYLVCWKLRLSSNFVNRYEVIWVFTKWLLVRLIIEHLVFSPIHGMFCLLLVTVGSSWPLRAQTAFV